MTTKGRDKRLPQMQGVEQPPDLRSTPPGELLVACDGSGKGRVGVVIWSEASRVAWRSVDMTGFEKITNNTAEYFAIVVGLETLLEADHFLTQQYKHYTAATLVTDSQLVVNQLSPLLKIPTDTPYNIKNPDLQILADRVVDLWDGLIAQGKKLRLQWASREDNSLRHADTLSKNK